MCAVEDKLNSIIPENTIINKQKIEFINSTEQQTTPNMETKQTKGLNRNTIDKYYTKDIVVELCLNLVKKYIHIKLVLNPYQNRNIFKFNPLLEC